MESFEARASQMKKLQKEMDTLLKEMHDCYGHTLGDPLVDQNGFPRQDIDVYSVAKLLGRYKQVHAKWCTLRKEIEEEVLR